jgi:hypothetical protein
LIYCELKILKTENKHSTMAGTEIDISKVVLPNQLVELLKPPDAADGVTYVRHDEIEPSGYLHPNTGLIKFNVDALDYCFTSSDMRMEIEFFISGWDPTAGLQNFSPAPFFGLRIFSRIEVDGGTNNIPLYKIKYCQLRKLSARPVGDNND